MKTIILAATASAALITLAAPAASWAQDNSWYVRGDTGASFSGRIGGAGGPRSDNGYVVGAGVGRSFDNGFRADAQVLYQQNQGKSGWGDQKVLGGFVNGYYDFLPGSQWRPFVGAGVGVQQVKLEREGTRPSGDKSVFAYQVQAGVSHEFTNTLTGEVAYRYIGAPDVKIGNGASRVEGDFGASLVTVGLRYRFGG